MFAQSTFHTIFINANQDADFTVQVGARTYTKAETVEIPDPPIKSGKPGDPFKGWKLESSESAKKYVVTFKPLAGFYLSNDTYVKEFDIPAGYNYFTYSTNVIYEPTKIEVWSTFENADFVNPPKAPFTLSGPATYSGQVGSVSAKWEKEKVPWGTYTITWADVPGYITPPLEIKRIVTEPEYDPPAPGGKLKSGIFYRTVADGKATFTAYYRKVGSAPLPPPQPKTYCEGTVNIDPAYPGLKGIQVGSNSSRATFTISGQEKYTGEGNIWSHADSPSGTYTIGWGDVSGCKTPPPETKILKDNVIVFLGNYTPLGAATKSSSPPPAKIPSSSILPSHDPRKTPAPPSSPKQMQGQRAVGEPPPQPQEKKSVQRPIQKSNFFSRILKNFFSLFWR